MSPWPHPALGHEVAPVDGREGGGLELRRAAGERRVEVVRQQHPLAPEGVVRGELRPQGRVGDLRREMREGDSGCLGRGIRRSRAGCEPGLAFAMQSFAQRRQFFGVGGESRLLLGGVVAAAARHDPRRGALEHDDLRAGRDERGHDLHRARAGADDGDLRAVEGHRVVPAGGVEHRPREAVEAGQQRDGRLGEAPAGEHEHLGEELRRAIAADIDAPGPLVVVPPGGQQRAAEPEDVAQARALDDALEIALDLGAGRELRRPGRIEVIGQAVEVRGHIAGDAGVGVLAPGAAGAVGAFEHDDLVAGGTCREGRRDAGEPGADDDDLDPFAVHARTSRATGSR